VATQSGYSNCYNVLEGFEGDRNTGNQRNVLNGWRRKGLPWEQS
jgi:rhodanese-related sulfurtransferase